MSDDAASTQAHENVTLANSQKTKPMTHTALFSVSPIPQGGG